MQNNLPGNTVPPQAPEVEEIVLGSVMLENESAAKALTILKPDDFYMRSNQIVFKAVKHLYEAGQSCNLLEIESWLSGKNLLSEVGGIDYLADLTRSVASAYQIEFHCSIVKGKSKARKSIETFREMIKRAHDPEEDIHQMLIDAERFVYSTLSGESADQMKVMPELMRRSFDEIMAAQEQNGIIGLATGLTKIDRTLGGLQGGKQYILAARPGMGKSALMLQVCKHIAKNGGRPGILSLEMGGTSLAKRLLLSEAGIDSQKAQKGNLTPSDKDQIEQARDRLSTLNLIIDDTTDLTPSKLRIKARMMKQVHKCGLLAVDYLQLMRGDDTRVNREQQVSEISRTLKLLSKELDIPVLALAQLSRKCDDRSGFGTRPQLSDLRESGSIEQDADAVIFIYRPEVYGLKVYEDGSSTNGVAEILLEKHRDGPIGRDKLIFDTQLQNFKPLDVRPDPQRATKPLNNWHEPESDDYPF